jgi:hypothetical protein
MTPSYVSRNRTKRYRYYVCCAAQKLGWARCPSKSIPARALEQLVLERIQRLGEDGSLLRQARGATDSTDLGGVGEDAGTASVAVEEVLALVRPGHETLPPLELARRLGVLVQQVEYDGARNKVAITFHRPVLAKVAEALLSRPEATRPGVQT